MCVRVCVSAVCVYVYVCACVYVCMCACVYVCVIWLFDKMAAEVNS